MSYETGKRLKRYDDIERRADGYLKGAIEAGNQPRAFRAARLLEAAHRKAGAIAFAHVSRYTEA